MAIIKEHDMHGYTAVHNFPILYDKRLPDKDVGVLVFCLCHDPLFWEYNQAGIAKNSTDGLAAVKSSVKHLKDSGYLSIKKKFNSKDNKIEKHIYIFNEIPEDIEDETFATLEYAQLGADLNGDPVKNGIINSVKNKKANFTCIDHTFINDASLSFAEKGMLCRLMALHPDYNPTIENLARTFGETKGTVSKTLNSLIKKGYITKIDLARKRGQFAGSNLKVRAVSVFAAQPEVEKPTSVPQLQKIRTQTTTYISKTNFDNNLSESSNKKIKVSITSELSRGEAKKRIDEKLLSISNDKTVDSDLLTVLTNELKEIYSSDKPVYRAGKVKYDRQTLIDKFEKLDNEDIKTVLSRAGEADIKVPALYMLRVIYNWAKSPNNRKSAVQISSPASYDLESWRWQSLHGKLEYKRRKA